MTTKLDLPLLRKQSSRMKEEMPELFEYLAERDKATFTVVQSFAHCIPNPDDLPVFKIPFIDVIIEALQPQKDCPVCDEPEDGQLWVLSAAQRARLCFYCRNGIYLRGSGVAALVDHQ